MVVVVVSGEKLSGTMAGRGDGLVKKFRDVFVAFADGVVKMSPEEVSGCFLEAESGKEKTGPGVVGWRERKRLGLAEALFWWAAASLCSCREGLER